MIDPARVLDDLNQPGLVSGIDFLRWFAAAVVVIAHARFPLLKGYGALTPDERPLWVQGWYFVTGYFVEAVLVFFVLSGFLVGGMVCARLARKSMDVGGYAIDRFSRLYTAFLPALLLTALLTWIGMTWFDGTGLYDASNPTFAEKGTAIDFGDNAGIGTFIGNLLMLQYYFVAPFGANPPLWTLSSEFWFYAVAGLAAAATLKRGPARLLLAALALAAAIALGPMFLFYLAMWLTGVAAAVIRPPKWPLTWPALALLAAVLLLRRYADGVLEPGPALRLALQAAVCAATGLLLLAWRARPPRWGVPLARFNQAMADFSYSLYLTHFPVIVVFVAAMGTLTGHPGYAAGFAPTHPLAVATYAGAVVLAFVVAWLFAQGTERHTGSVRRWLKRRRKAPAAPPATPEPSAPTTTAG